MPTPSSAWRKSLVAAESCVAYFVTRAWSHFASPPCAAPRVNTNAAAAARMIPLSIASPPGKSRPRLPRDGARSGGFSLLRAGGGLDGEGAALLLASAFHLGPGLHLRRALTQRSEQLLPPRGLGCVRLPRQAHHLALDVHPAAVAGVGLDAEHVLSGRERPHSL